MNHKWISWKSKEDNDFFEYDLHNNGEYWSYSRCKNCKLYRATVVSKIKNKQRRYFFKWHTEALCGDEVPSCGEIIMINVME